MVMVSRMRLGEGGMTEGEGGLGGQEGQAVGEEFSEIWVVDTVERRWHLWSDRCDLS